MTIRCLVCRKPALMGFHPICIWASCIHRPKSTIYLSHPCAHCPFRKDIPFWLDKGRWILNKLRLRYNNPQDCHMDERFLCEGQRICSSGGDKQVMSPEQFAVRKPIPIEEMAERYDRATDTP